MVISGTIRILSLRQQWCADQSRRENECERGYFLFDHNKFAFTQSADKMSRIFKSGSDLLTRSQGFYRRVRRAVA